MLREDNQTYLYGSRVDDCASSAPSAPTQTIAIPADADTDPWLLVQNCINSLRTSIETVEYEINKARAIQTVKPPVPNAGARHDMVPHFSPPMNTDPCTAQGKVLAAHVYPPRLPPQFAPGNLMNPPEGAGGHTASSVQCHPFPGGSNAEGHQFLGDATPGTSPADPRGGLDPTVTSSSKNNRKAPALVMKLRTAPVPQGWELPSQSQPGKRVHDRPSQGQSNVTNPNGDNKRAKTQVCRAPTHGDYRKLVASWPLEKQASIFQILEETEPEQHH